MRVVVLGEVRTRLFDRGTQFGQQRLVKRVSHVVKVLNVTAVDTLRKGKLGRVE